MRKLGKSTIKMTFYCDHCEKEVHELPYIDPDYPFFYYCKDCQVYMISERLEQTLNTNEEDE